MSYVDAISNALAARGSALAQGELQRGQVWGNLAQNLGQIPGQAIAFHQQRERAMQDNELKKIAIEKAQRTADREKRAIQIVNSGKPKDQIYAELKMLASEDPEDFLKFQHAESQLAIQQQHLDLDTAQKDFTMRSGQPGTEFERPIVPQPQNNALGVGGPPIPVPQRQMEFEKMVHPVNALGVRPPTDVDVRERTAATDALAMKKYGAQQEILEKNREKLEGVKSVLKPPPATKQIERTVDLGDKIEYVYTDGTRETKKKGMSPGSATASQPTVTIVTRNERGEDVTKVLTKAEALKLSHGENAGILRATPAMTRNRITAAQNSMKMGEELIKALDDPQVQAGLGPVMGRATGFQGLVGNIPPEMAELRGLLKSWSELQPAVHGMRSSEMAEEIEKSAPTHWTPEALKGFVRGFQRTAKTVAESELPAGGGGPKAEITPAEAAAELARRRSKK